MDVAYPHSNTLVDTLAVLSSPTGHTPPPHRRANRGLSLGASDDFHVFRLAVICGCHRISSGIHGLPPPTSSSLEKSNLKARDGYALVLRNDQKDCRG